MLDRSDLMLRFDLSTGLTDTFAPKRKPRPARLISVLITPNGRLNVFSTLSNLV